MRAGRCRKGLAILLLLLSGLRAEAAVTIDFYSHKLAMAPGLNTYFPHGFALLSGATDDGTPVKANLGFTAKNVFFNILWERVSGELDPTPLPQGYVEGAIRHFAFALTDAQYRAVMAVAEKWRNWPQPSYDIDDHNCVIFIREIAAAAGLAVSDDKKFIHAPGELLEDMAQRNAAFIAAHGTRFTVAPAGDARALEQRVRQLERDARQRAN